MRFYFKHQVASFHLNPLGYASGNESDTSNQKINGRNSYLALLLKQLKKLTSSCTGKYREPDLILEKLKRNTYRSMA